MKKIAVAKKKSAKKPSVSQASSSMRTLVTVNAKESVGKVTD